MDRAIGREGSRNFFLALIIMERMQLVTSIKVYDWPMGEMIMDGATAI